MEKLYKQFGFQTKSIDKEKGTVFGVFSTMDVDRHGDIVMQNWNLDQFRNNPVILNSHNYWDTAEVIGKALTDLGVVDNQLQGTIQFAVNENPKAKVAFDLVVGGYLNAFSVGFMPEEFSKDGVILKSTLLEISLVSVPANPHALVQAKSAGIRNITALYPFFSKELVEDEKEEEEVEEGEEQTEEEEAKEVEEKVEKIIKKIKPKNKTKIILSLIANASKAYSASQEVETRSKTVRAEKRRLINKAVRELLKTR